MNNIDIKTKELEILLDYTFVNEYDIVMDWMNNVNAILSVLNINYTYDSYDTFCMDYKKECLDYVIERQDIDFSEPDSVLMWVPRVLSNLITSKLFKHGEKLGIQDLDILQN
jgi:hypothetical protein